MTGVKFVLFFFVSLFCQIYGKEHVPVLIWNTKQAQGGVPAVSALQYINYGTFQAKYLQAFKPKNILLFLQDALSVEDLSSHASEFQHVKKWMDGSHALYLPNVEAAAHLAHDLPSHGYNVVVLEPGIPSAGLDLKQQDNNLVVVKLPSTLTNPSRSRAMQKADEVMQNVISKVGEKREFTVIFTGLKPSVEDNSEQYEERIRVARSLKAFSDGPPGFHTAGNGCTLMYYRKDIVIYLNSTTNKNNTLDDSQADTHATGDCSDSHASIRIKYTDIVFNGQTHDKAYIDFDFDKKNYQWTLTGAKSHFGKDYFEFSLVSPKVSGIPLNMSYSCSQPLVFRNNRTGDTVAEMIVSGVQVQPYNYKQQFDDAWDCIGFFTVSIWAGLLVTLLLVVILSTGMFMLSDIKTMDRFDDPKGQGIMVPASAE